MRAIADRRGEGTALTNLGAIYLSLEDKQNALKCYGEALPVLQAVGDRRAEAYALLGIGRAHDQAGDKQKALDYNDQALVLMRAVGDQRGEGNTLHNTAALHASLNHKERALELGHQALQLLRHVGDRGLEAATLYTLARVERDLGNWDGARSRIESGLALIEPVRTRIGGQELRASYFASVRSYYEFYIDLLMGLHRLRPSDGFEAAALQASERARARTLLEALTEARVDIRRGIEPELIDQERRLQQLMNAKSESLMRLPGTAPKEKHAVLKSEVEAILAEYQDVQARIRIGNPDYAALTQPQPMSLSEIRQLLDGETMLIEYALGEERSFLWAVTSHETWSFELPKRAEIEALARRLYQLLTSRNQRVNGETAVQKRARTAEAEAEYPKAAAALSSLLLGPVVAQLGTKRLLIVGEGALQYVPFGALPVPTAPGKQQPRKEGGEWTPLIAEHEIVSLPSASVLAVLRREMAGRKLAPKTLAVLADPVFDPDDSRVKKAGTEARTGGPGTQARAERGWEQEVERAAKEAGVTNAGLRLPRLLFTRREAEGIYGLAPPAEAMKALDFSARRPAVIGGELSPYRHVHIATHGMLNSEHPELSGLVLSLVDEQGRPQDRFLRLHEIYNLKLPTELVVLSACQTALGREIKGEGLVGLTRGFMYAGAPRVVASLWKVDDEATAHLMRTFYEGMLGKHRLRPAAALQAAQMAIWKENRWRAPYYWAAFVLQGEWK